MTKDYFLDTSVLIKYFLGADEKVIGIIDDPDLSFHTIEYVIKEIRFVLLKRLGLSIEHIGNIIEHIRDLVRIHKNPPPKAYKKLKIRDKSDKPIVYAAMELRCTLLIDDEMTYVDATKYIDVKRLKDL